jgi:uncharacterized protein YbcI
MSVDEVPEQQAGQDTFSIQMQVSNEMVRLYKEQFGRGPTKARTNWAGPDMLLTVLEDTLTPAERNLVKLGEHQRLRDLRMFFQYASIKEFCAPVERLTGRKVRSFHSSIDTKADGMSMEVFVLYPEGYDGPSRAELADS